MSNVSSKGQITIPKHIRDLLSIELGESHVDFIVIDGHVHLVNKSSYNPFQEAMGISKGKLSSDEVMALTRDL